MRREGKRVRTERLELRFLASPSLRPRIGIIVPRHHRSAVARNRVKRRLRELLRTELLPLLRGKPALDVVVRATPEAYAAPFGTLAADIGTFAELLLRRA